MAWEEDGEGVGADGGTGGAGGGGVSGGACDLLVGLGLSVGDAGEGLPDVDAKGGGVEGVGDGEGGAFVCKVFEELGLCLL